jgi:hypothetical protein
MRVSEYFDLGRTQPTLDFVDVRLDTDTRAYIDPTAIRVQDSEWADACQALLQSYFTEVLEAASSSNDARSRRLMTALSEPNEVHLGFSKGRSRGRGLGPKIALDFLEAIRTSQAAQSRLLSDLEDTALLLDGVRPDLISDITTNVIRGALIGYTQAICEFYGIDLVEQYTGPVWNPNALEWQEGFERLPRADDEVLLLVPKSIVRLHLTVSADRYYNHQIAPRLEAIELENGSPLVQVLKNGVSRVPRAKLKEKYPADKLAIVKYSNQFPDALGAYKRSLTKVEVPPMTHGELRERLGTPAPDFRRLLEDLNAIPPGNAGATLYHRACEKLLTAMFYPYLGNVRIENEIHDGRKRIDITYDNLADQGTFFWLAANYKCAVLPIECKNYSSELGNPELDQIGSRLSDRRGWVGIVVFRAVQDKELLLKRCRDSAHDGRGWIIPLDDQDLENLVEERVSMVGAPKREQAFFKIVRKRFDYLIS